MEDSFSNCKLVCEFISKWQEVRRKKTATAPGSTKASHIASTVISPAIFLNLSHYVIVCELIYSELQQKALVEIKNISFLSSVAFMDLQLGKPLCQSILFKFSYFNLVKIFYDAPYNQFPQQCLPICDRI